MRLSISSRFASPWLLPDRRLRPNVAEANNRHDTPRKRSCLATVPPDLAEDLAITREQIPWGEPLATGVVHPPPRSPVHQQRERQDDKEQEQRHS